MIVPVHGRIWGENEHAKLRAVVDSDWYTAGPWCHQFERKLADYLGVRHVALCNSGSSANLLAISALELSPGDEVITTAVNFPTTLNPIIQVGAVPVFVDVKLPMMTADVTQLEAALSGKTRAVVLAHTLGYPFELSAVVEFCEKHDLSLIEDCCLAAGTKIKVLGGDKNIEDVRRGDYVLTRSGYKKVLESRTTGIKKVVTKFGITATPDHPVITRNGAKELQKLNASDTIYLWNEKSLSIEERIIYDTQSRPADILGFTSGTIAELASRALCMFRSGLITLARSLRDIMFTTGIAIRSTTIYPIWNCYPVQSMSGSTSIKIRGLYRNFSIISAWPERGPLSGINPQKAERCTGEYRGFLGRIGRLPQRFANCAERNIKPISLVDRGFALEIAKSKTTNETAVYNLLVEDSHEFFANNILVHNCDALGSLYNGRKTGTFGQAATFSFYPAHQISTGEGGAIATRSGRMDRVICSYRDWGRDCWCAPGQDNTCGTRYDGDYDHKYTYSRIGYNLKATEFEGALGVAQMDRLPAFVAFRHVNHVKLLWLARNKGLEEYFILPVLEPHVLPSWFGFALICREGVNRNELCRYLDSVGVGNRPVFGGNILRQPAYRGLLHGKVNDLPNSNIVHERAFWIGCWPGLNADQLEYSIDMISRYVKGDAHGN